MGQPRPHLGPVEQFPLAVGRGYTPPLAPVERYVALLDHLGFAHGLVVQSNAHGYDNRIVLDTLARYPERLRGIAITDTRVAPDVLRAWHRLGMRGLRSTSFRTRGGRTMCGAAVSTCSRSSVRSCASSAGSCKYGATGA